MILILFFKEFLNSYDQQDHAYNPLLNASEQQPMHYFIAGTSSIATSQENNKPSQRTHFNYSNNSANTKEELHSLLDNKTHLDLMSLIKNGKTKSETLTSIPWISHLNSISLRYVKEKKSKFNLDTILSQNITLKGHLHNFPTNTTFDLKTAFVHYFITSLNFYSESVMIENRLYEIEIVCDLIGSKKDIQDLLVSCFDYINLQHNITSIHYEDVISFAQVCFPGYINLQQKFYFDLSGDLSHIQERINHFMFFISYFNQENQQSDIISRFRLILDQEFFSFNILNSKLRTNILEKLCNIYLDKFAFFEIFSLLSYIKNNFIPFESYKKLESTIIFIILLNSFYSNYCEYYKNVVMKSHDFASQERFNIKPSIFDSLKNTKDTSASCTPPAANMLLNSMYLSKIFFLLLIFDLNLQFPYFFKSNMFLYVIHLKIFYFPNKDLSEIYNEISFEEKSCFGVLDSNIDSLVNFKGYINFF